MNIKYTNSSHYSTKDKILLILKQRASMKLTSKYKTSIQYYRSTLINYIIYNEKSHIVALFKDYLIIDDSSEFLKRYYSTNEAMKRLPKFFDYYETYSKIFPNYTSILEGKYIYFNIQRKQKIINIQEEMELGEKNQRKKNYYTDEVFSTDIYDSIVNDRNNEDLEEVFNLNEKSYEDYSKLKELLNKIERNDNEKQCYYDNSNNNTNLNLNQSGNNIQIQSCVNTKNSMSNKKKLMISSLLGRNQSMCNNNAKTLSLKNNNNDNNTQRIYYHNNSSMSNCNVPLTDRQSSANKKKSTYSHKIGKLPQSRQVNRTKIISDYPKTVFNDDYIQSRIYKAGDQGIPMSNKTYGKKEINDVVFDKEREKDHIEKSQIKTKPKCTNNIIYIINQNPKFMTNVTLYNNPNHKSSTKCLTVAQNQVQNNKVQSQCQVRAQNQNCKAHGQSYYHTKALSNVQSSQFIKKKSARIETIKSSSKNKLIEQYLFDNQTTRTRNNVNHLMSKELLITSREYSNKDYLNLKTSSQMTIEQKNNFKSKINNFITTTNTKDYSGLKSSSKDILTHRSKIDIVKLRNDSSLTRKTNGIIVHHGTLAYTNTINTKHAIKGIQIKNFNKVIGLNFTAANSERNNQKGYYHL